MQRDLSRIHWATRGWSRLLTMVFTALLVLTLPGFETIGYAQAGLSWTTLPGLAFDIGIGADGTVWVIGTDRATWRWNGSDWERHQAEATRIAVAPNGTPWIVGLNNEIFQGPPVNGVWQRMPGAALDIGIGANGQVWVIGTDNSPYVWTGADWVQYAGEATRIAVGSNGAPWMVNAAGEIRGVQMINGEWQKLPGGALDIDVGANGSVWIVGLDGTPWRWNGSTWELHPGEGLAALAVDPKGAPWGTGTSTAITRATLPTAAATAPAPPPPPVEVPVATKPGTGTAGTATVLDILCRYSDNAAEPLSVEKVHTMWNGPRGLERYIQEQSFGALGFKARTIGWYALPRTLAEYSGTGGDWFTPLTGDCAAAAARDANVAEYDIVVVHVNGELPQRTGGRIQFEITPAGAAIPVIAINVRGLNSPALVAHELSHLHGNIAGHY